MKRIYLIIEVGFLFGFFCCQNSKGGDRIYANERPAVRGISAASESLVESKGGVLQNDGNDLNLGQSQAGGDRIVAHSRSRILANYVPGEIVVKFKADVPAEIIAELNLRHGVSVIYTSSFAGFMRLKILGGKTVFEILDTYRKIPNVEYAELNYIAYACWAPNDPLYAYQWHLDNPQYGGIHIENAWQLLGAPGTPGQNVIVAVVDTGVAYENYTKSPNQKYYKAPDLENTVFVPGYDFVEIDEHPNDDNSHGTHVTGTIVQSTNNGQGCAGVAFKAAIMPVKVLDKDGSGYYSWIADGIYFAVDNGAHAINLSLGGTSPSVTLENAVAYAYNKGVTVICAAGNEYLEGNPPQYPAAYDAYCIAVGATRYDETRAYYSNTGSYLDISAPGGDINVDQNGDGYADGVLQNTFNPNSKRTNEFGYWFFQGTSMAAPHVSGVAALLIANGNAVTPAAVRAALQDTAEDLGDPGRDDIYGYGLVDAYAALSYTPVWLIYFQDWELGPAGQYSMYDGWFSKYYYTISPDYDPICIVVDADAPSPTLVHKISRIDSASNYLSPLIPVTPGERYIVGAWIKWESGGWPFVGVSRYNAFGSPIGLPLYDPETAPRLIWLIGKGDYHMREGYTPQGDLVTAVPEVDGWHYYEKIFTVLTGTAYVRIMTELWKGGSRGGDPLAYFDDIAMYAIAPGSSYRQ